MTLFRTLGALALLGSAGAGLNGCIQAPDYAVEPDIDFAQLNVTRVPRVGGQNAIDTLQFVINFRDGDGDLGLNLEDISKAPYNSTTGGHNNLGYGNNYFIQPYKKNVATGVFEKFVINGNVGQYDGRYPRLDGTDAKPAPLKGVLRYKLPLRINGAPFFPGDVFRFEISIMDRGLHESNTVTSSEVTLGVI